jgi:RHS repeat-associated protein
MYTPTLGTMTTSSRVTETYDSYGNTTSVSKYDFGATSPTEITTTAYGSYNNTTHQCQAVGNAINNRPCEVIVSDGQHTLSDTRFTYEITGNLTSKASWVSGTNWLTTTATYNSNGTVRTAYDSNNNLTTYAYNGTGGCNNGFQTSVTSGGLTSSTTWDCNGAVKTSSTDANGQVTNYTYADLLWRQTLVSSPDGGSTSTSYAVGGTSISTSTAITSTTNLTKTTLFDGLGRVSQTQLTSDPDGTDYVDTTYDSEGRKTTVSNPHRTGSLPTDGITTYGYDALNRIVSVLQPDGSSQSTTYANNCSTATDEAGNARKSCFDGLGRLTTVWEDPGSAPHLNYETDYLYDALGNLKSVTQIGDGSGNRNRSFNYDGLSRITSAQNPESGTITYSYANPNGSLCSGDPESICQRIAPSPNQPASGTATVTTTYTYDSLNRRIAKAYQDSYTGNPATAAVKYGYDGIALTGCTTTPPVLTDTYPLGRRTAMCDGSGASSWGHDKMGRIIQEYRTIGSVAGEHETDSYNLDGSVRNVTSLGQTTGYNYNGAGRQTGTGNNATGPNIYVSNATYAPFGGVATMNMGASNPVSVSDSYNSRMQPAVLSATSASGTIMNLTFDFHSSTHADNGNVFQIANNRDSSRTQNFTYDALNRIKNAYTTGANWGEDYTIDGWGNLTNIARHSGKNQSETLNCAGGNTKNQLNTCYIYDAAGNMIGTATYTYDAENRLIATASTSYIYDGDGKRVEKCTQGTTPGTCAANATGTMYWTGWQSNTLSETDLAGNVQEQYIYFNGSRIARLDVPSGAVHYYFSDHLGTHSLITDALGHMPPQKESDYYPYGGEIMVSGSDANHYKFTGKERDAESGLDNFGARHYASALGRFMQTDPINIKKYRLVDPQRLNLYSYTRNSPTIAIDSDGKEIIFKDVQQATQALNAARGGLPQSQRDAVYVRQSENNQLQLAVNPDSAKAAGKDSLLGRLEKVATDSKVAEVNFVGANDSLKAIKFGVASITDTFTLSGKGLDGITLPEFGGKDHPQYNNVGLNSTQPGVTEVDISNTASDESQALFHETLVHVESFFDTGNARLSDEQHQQNNADQVEKEVEKNEKPQ